MDTDLIITRMLKSHWTKLTFTSNAFAASWMIDCAISTIFLHSSLWPSAHIFTITSQYFSCKLLQLWIAVKKSLDRIQKSSSLNKRLVMGKSQTCPFCCCTCFPIFILVMETDINSILYTYILYALCVLNKIYQSKSLACSHSVT